MSTTLADIKTLADDRRRSASTAVIDWTGNGFRAINGALQVWNQTHDWPWQVQSTTFNYNEGITWYPLAASLNFKAVLDLAPFRTSDKGRELPYVTNNAFDSNFEHPWRFAIQTQDQADFLRVKYTGDATVLTAATGLSDNGTWVGATAISNVATDSYEFLDQQSSVKFDYSGTSGTLTNDSMTAVDVSRYAQRSTVYFNVYLQSVTTLTGITLKVGTDASNYITGSITTDYLGNALTTGWNKCKLVWNGTTTVVGTLDTASFGYVQFTVAYDSNPSTVSNRIENIFISENVPMTFQYYSNAMITDISGAAKLQGFNDSAATTDTTLWSGRWDYVNEAFVNSLMEIVAWMNGDTSDRDVAIDRIKGFVEPLKSRLPSRRRYPEMGFTADVNLGGGAPGRYPNNRYIGY